jgi:presenilin-like A22 family membrane protease
VRLALLAMAGGLVGVFAVAIWLDPYDRDGTPLRMQAHTQLGLPQCTFYEITGLPCPSCGLTTSFSLLVHGDLVNSGKANVAGTLLAVFCLALIPWALVCVYKGRLWIIRSLERSMTWVVLILFTLMLVRWGIVVWLD